MKKLRYILNRPTHISWIIAFLCFGILLGIILAGWLELNYFQSSAWISIAAVTFFAACIRRVRLSLLICILAGVFLGLWRGSTVNVELLAYQELIGKTVEIKGRVAQDVAVGPKGDERVEIDRVSINGQHYGGALWISFSSQNNMKRGDTILAKGTLQQGFGSAAATIYRAEIKEVEQQRFADPGRQFRDWFASSVRSAIEEPAASLGLGYLVGQRSALPEGLERNIQLVGLTHVVVASGYNLTILVVFARRIFARISKFLAAFAGAGMIAWFLVITGFTPSMSRAGLVAGLGLLAWYYGRRIHPYVLLVFAAASTALIKPQYVWGDIGWHLSFAAFFGILVLAPLLHSYFWGKERPGIIRELLVATFAAQAATLPLILAVFGTYSVYSLVANALILPVVPFAMLTTFIAGLGSLIMPQFAAVFGYPAELVLNYCIGTINKIAGLPNAEGSLLITSKTMIISYIAILCIVTYLIKATQFNFRKAKTIVE